jgi:hypothetical protein
MGNAHPLSVAQTNPDHHSVIAEATPLRFHCADINVRLIPPHRGDDVRSELGLQTTKPAHTAARNFTTWNECLFVQYVLAVKFINGALCRCHSRLSRCNTQRRPNLPMLKE